VTLGAILSDANSSVAPSQPGERRDTEGAHSETLNCRTRTRLPRLQQPGEQVEIRGAPMRTVDPRSTSSAGQAHWQTTCFAARRKFGARSRIQSEMLAVTSVTSYGT
jgi:hypothetical protein